MAISNWDLDALTRDPGIVSVVQQATDRIAEIARADAPTDTNAYKAGIRTRIKYQDRAVGVVEATDPKSLIIEAKTGNLARAVKKAARKR
ncbi:hypothetical protein [Microbacterium sp. XT11]|uniref:hypothetical protein n=1 Tax=Microbacterium sp. XT11 TaxID=367477 RepID=UPI0008378B1F|nr:hypothetical protein [Microbacterium sp. XT11]